MTLRKYFMQLSEETYEELGDGLVRVTGKDGRTGTFRYDGPWVEGALREANLNMLIFCGGPTVPAAFNFRWQEVPCDLTRESGWPEQNETHLREIGVIGR